MKKQFSAKNLAQSSAIATIYVVLDVVSGNHATLFPKYGDRIFKR